MDGRGLSRSPNTDSLHALKDPSAPKDEKGKKKKGMSGSRITRKRKEDTGRRGAGNWKEPLCLRHHVNGRS